MIYICIHQNLVAVSYVRYSRAYSILTLCQLHQSYYRRIAKLLTVVSQVFMHLLRLCQLHQPCYHSIAALLTTVYQIFMCSLCFNYINFVTIILLHYCIAVYQVFMRSLCTNYINLITAALLFCYFIHALLV